MPQTKKMKNIYAYVAGTTFDCHEDFIKKLTKRGAKRVDSHEKSNTIIVFCPIVSRYLADINSALSGAPEFGDRVVILVAMHHTFDKDYTLPNHTNHPETTGVSLFVDCLFFEQKGLLDCSFNKKAIKQVRKKLGLSKFGR